LKETISDVQELVEDAEEMLDQAQVRMARAIDSAEEG